MNWKCDTCGVEVLETSRWSHLKSSGHLMRLTSENNDGSCTICKGKISHRNKARHNRSRDHVAAVALAEVIRQRNILQQQLETLTVKSDAPNTEEKEPELTLDQFIVADCARYVKWMRDNPQHSTVYQNPRSVIYTVINNLYAAIACNNPTCAWWPQELKLPTNASTWRENLLHRSIGDVAMAESILIVAQSGLAIESK